jgi:hypothetical protein
VLAVGGNAFGGFQWPGRSSPPGSREEAYFALFQFPDLTLVLFGPTMLIMTFDWLILMLIM